MWVIANLMLVLYGMLHNLHGNRGLPGLQDNANEYICGLDLAVGACCVWMDEIFPWEIQPLCLIKAAITTCGFQRLGRLGSNFSQVVRRPRLQFVMCG